MSVSYDLSLLMSLDDPFSSISPHMDNSCSDDDSNDSFHSVEFNSQRNHYHKNYTTCCAII